MKTTLSLGCGDEIAVGLSSSGQGVLLQITRETEGIAQARAFLTRAEVLALIAQLAEHSLLTVFDK